MPLPGIPKSVVTPPAHATLTSEFDGLLARMQTPAVRKGMRAAFDATPARMGRAAVAAARKRG